MPHITLECTSNITTDFQDFFKELSTQLIATGHVSKFGVKCRLLITDTFFIVDGNQNYKMVNLLFRLREGRSEEVLQNFSKIGMELMEKNFQKDVESKTIILSTEIKELIKGLDLTKNSIR